MKKYNREEYIRNYHLTDDEYRLLPINLRRAYVHKLYSYEIDKLHKSKEDVLSFKGNIKDIYFDYFKFRGFKIENYDFGTLEHEIRQDGEYVPYEPSKIEITELINILTYFAEIRASYFELNIKDQIKTTERDFSKGVLDLDKPISLKGYYYYLYNELTSNKFTDTERKTLVSAQINYVLANSSSLYLGDYKYYASYLKKCGFKEVEQEKILSLFK